MPKTQPSPATLRGQLARGREVSADTARRLREQARRTDGRFGEQARTAPDVTLPTASGAAAVYGRINSPRTLPRRYTPDEVRRLLAVVKHVRARNVDVWLGDARRFTIDGIMHSRRGGRDRFLTLQFSTDPSHLKQMQDLSDRDGMQGIAIRDPQEGRPGARYDPERVLEVHVFHQGRAAVQFVSPARLVELTHQWFASGQDEPLVTAHTEDDTPATQQNYRAMNPFSNRYRDDRTRPSGMRDYATWWREPAEQRGLGFMDGDSCVVTERGFDLLELKNGHGELEGRMKAGQRMTLEAWGRLEGCRAFAVDENGTSDRTQVVEYSGGRGIAYESSLAEMHDRLTADA
ncbi:hypothetical protein [Microbacterium sp. 13-71-7]|jgi:hypothetical protein|uniref:hypothetical protein n=1 Tax=Microbacterium sp. 13-71-7 TaxID=1970399 RepID=UPI000BCA6DC4|nr:hypothetical protein [Microbacterium sp. 13-71-7]OZB84380.1 MAG: hypothetical protein B7X32_07385 [Microbacterium sp. 13-71-7]